MPQGSRGILDGISQDGWLTGWALSSDPRKERARLTINADETKIGEVLADQFREDLGAALGDSNCAYWFRLPDSIRDGKTHRISIQFLDSGEPLDNSPKDVMLGKQFGSDAGGAPNFVSNANLLKWPNGVVVQPKERFLEVASQWFFDFRQGTEPHATFSLAEPLGISTGVGNYGIRVSFAEPPTGYARLVVPLDQSTPAAGVLRFSCGFMRLSKPHQTRLTISEIFLGVITDKTLLRMSTIRKNVSPHDTIRLHDIRVEYSTAPDTHLALVFDFKGAGELVIFGPSLSENHSDRHRQISEADFEDPNVRSQIDAIQLSSIWQKGAAVSRCLEEGGEPLTVSSVSGQAIRSGIPFTQIIVPVFNAYSDVTELLESIIKNTTSPYEVLLLDDGSRDLTARGLEKWTRADPRIKHVRHQKNIGYTANINFGFHISTAAYAVLMNSDVVVTPQWLEKLHEAMASDDQTAAVGPVSNAASWQSVPRTKTSQGGWAVNAIPPGTTIDGIARLVEQLSIGAFPEFPLLNGFCTLFRREPLERVGFFDAHAFPSGYGEENDLCVRLRSKGYRLRVADHCYVFHKKSKSFGNAKRLELSKQSNGVFRAKHPNVNVAALELEMQSNPILKQLRDQLMLRDRVELGRPARLIRVKSRLAESPEVVSERSGAHE